MLLFFYGSGDIGRLAGLENSEKRQQFLAQFRQTFGSGFEPVFRLAAGRLPVKILLQQWAERPFPPTLQNQGLTSAYYQAQFQNPHLTHKPDVVMLSIEPDLTLPVWQHRTDGFLLCPEPETDQGWLQEEFEPLGLTTPEAFQADLEALAKKIESRFAAPVLVLNASTIDPADDVFTYNGLGNHLPVRINRFNLALLRLSMSLGIAIVDVDRLAAEAGDPHVTSPLHYSDGLNKTLRQEIVRIVNDLDLDNNNHRLYKLQMPYIDLTIKEGVVSNWYKAVGDPVAVGDNLVDLEVGYDLIQRTHSARFLSRKRTRKAPAKRGRALVRLISAGDGQLHEIFAGPGTAVQHGALMGAITAETLDPALKPELDIHSAAIFKVSAQKLSIGTEE